MERFKEFRFIRAFQRPVRALFARLASTGIYTANRGWELVLRGKTNTLAIELV
jgi:hypothetical protein